MTDDTISRQAQIGTTSTQGLTPTLIVGHSFAQYWLEDARRESEGENWHNVRREILFSATFLEAYLFEWAQTQLTNDIAELLKLFPQDGNIPPLKKKWESTVGKIFELKLLGKPPSAADGQFDQLVKLRNRLLHGKPSRLTISSKTNMSWPDPSASDLQQIQNGWALGVALDMVQSLHSHAGTEQPPYVSRIAK